MIWGTFFLLAILSASLLSRFRTSTLVPLTFLATVFVIESPLLPGLSTSKFALILISLRLLTQRMRLHSTHILLIMLLAGYLVALSVAHLNLEIPNWANIRLGALQKPPIRNILSTALFVLAMLTFIFSAQVQDCGRVTTRLLNWYVKFAVVAAIFALFQVIVNFITPALNGFFALFSKSVILEGGGLNRLRPSPFVYEPRYFAIAMGIGVFLLQLKEREYLIPMRRYPRMAMIGLFLLMMLFAASTSAILTIATGFATYLLVKLKSTRGIRLLFWAAAIGGGLYLLAGSLNFLILDRFTLYLNRINDLGDDRLGTLGVLAYADWLRTLSVVELLVGKGLGNSAYFAFDYLSASSELSRKGFFSARINFFDMIGDMGLIGFTYIHFLWIFLLRRLRENHLSGGWGEKVHLLKLFCYFLIGVNLLFKSYTLIWLVLGLSWSCYRQGLQERSRLKTHQTGIWT